MNLQIKLKSITTTKQKATTKLTSLLLTQFPLLSQTNKPKKNKNQEGKYRKL